MAVSKSNGHSCQLMNCPRCNGTGKRAITTAYKNTLAAIKSLPGSRGTCMELLPVMKKKEKGLNIVALHKRVKNMLDAELVKRSKPPSGSPTQRAWVYEGV